ncbi:MAG: methyltransferase domain-containing protein [Arenicellales bacterium]
MNNTPETQWENRYQENKTGWDRGSTSLQLLSWLKSKALTPCRILVPGCGNGYEVITLAKAGFEVVALDIAPTPVKNLNAQLKEQSLSAEVIQADVLNWQGAPFDAIYEQTSLCAIVPEHWLEYEQQLRAWLKPQGQLFALFMQTNREGGPPYHCDLPQMQSLFSDTHWQWSTPEEAVTHPTGLHELAYVLAKRGVD